MVGLSILLALLALALALRPPERWRSGAGAGLPVFALGTAAVAMAVLEISARSRDWPAPALLAVGWFALRGLTRPERTARQRAAGAGAVLLAVLGAVAIVTVAPAA